LSALSGPNELELRLCRAAVRLKLGKPEAALEDADAALQSSQG
jgi:hypothetical protein